MILLNNIIVYNDVSNYYYTDGLDVYHKIKKEKYAKNYRVRYNNKSYIINEENYLNINSITKREYIFENNCLYRKLKWFNDKDGYCSMMVDTRKNPKKISQHRLVYFYKNNIIPQDNYVIDHIDRNKLNNDIDNLRLVSCKVNSNNVDKNNKKDKLSKYIYECIDIDTNISIAKGLASDIQNIIGIKSVEINRYAKQGYIYKNKYLIKILSRRGSGND